jgi:hypothetical protein
MFNSERKRGTGAVESRWNINGQSGLTQNEFWQSLEKDSAAKKTRKSRLEMVRKNYQKLPFR